MPSGVRPDFFRSLPPLSHETHFEETTPPAAHAASGDARNPALSACAPYGRFRRTDCLARDCGRPALSIWLSDHPESLSVVRVEEQHATSLTPGFMPFLPAQDRPGTADARWERTTAVSALSFYDVRLTAGDRDFPSGAACPARRPAEVSIAGPKSAVGARTRRLLRVLRGSSVFETKSILNERSLPAPFAHPTQPAVIHSPNTTCMTTTLSRAIPQLTEDGDLVLIPRAAWEDVILIAEEEFNAEISIHDHARPGAFHDLPFVPVPHYLIEVNMDEDRTDEFIERVNPLIEQLVERYTQQPSLPVGV